MKRFAYIAALAGGVLIVVLVARAGYQNIIDALALAGWPLLWLVPYHVLPIGLDAYGWRVLLKPRDPDGRARFPCLLWVALVREGVSRLLPVASVGGEVVGIRLIILRGIEGGAATASVIVEVLASLISQYVFTAIGVLLLITLLHSTELTDDLLLALALTFPIPLVLLLLLRNTGVFRRLERLAERLLGGRSGLAAAINGGANLDSAIQELLTHRARLLASMFWQFAGMMMGSFEIWFALMLLGHPVSVGAAIALEAVTLAIRHMAFLIPAGLGVQEAGLVVFGQMLGLSSDTALALSLIKRMRELVLGIPALLSWQGFEFWRIRYGLGRNVDQSG